jgi:hypothetical protein
LDTRDGGGIFSCIPSPNRNRASLLREPFGDRKSNSAITAGYDSNAFTEIKSRHIEKSPDKIA